MTWMATYDALWCWRMTESLKVCPPGACPELSISMRPRVIAAGNGDINRSDESGKPPRPAANPDCMRIYSPGSRIRTWEREVRRAGGRREDKFQRRYPIIPPHPTPDLRSPSAPQPMTNPWSTTVQRYLSPPLCTFLANGCGCAPFRTSGSLAPRNGWLGNLHFPVGMWLLDVLQYGATIVIWACDTLVSFVLSCERSLLR